MGLVLLSTWGRPGCCTGSRIDVVLVLTAALGPVCRWSARRGTGSPGGLSVGQVLVHGGCGQRLPGPVGRLGDEPPGVRIAGQPPGFRTGLDLDDVADGQRPVAEEPVE